MDDTKQPRNPNDLLIVHNPDNEDHEWQYDAIRTPLPYLLRAGETRELPYYLAKHGVNKLIDKLLQKKGLMHTNPLLRSQEMEKIVLGIQHINVIREKTPNEIALEDMQRKKDVDPFEELLKKREIQAEQQREAVLAAQRAPAPFMTTQGQPVTPVAATTPLPEQPSAPVVPVTPIVPQPAAVPPVAQPIVAQAAIPAQPVVNTVPQAAPVAPTADQIQGQVDPVRQNIYTKLVTKLHLDLTHQQTKERLDSMTTEQLTSEFASELPELINPAAAIVPDTKESLSQPGMPILNQNAQVPQQPVQAAPPAPAMPPPAPSISMNPAAAAAPILDAQLAGVK